MNADPAALRDAGLVRLKAGDLRQAAVLLGRAADLAPTDPKAQMGLGLAVQRAGSHVEALVSFELAETLAPDDAEAPLYASFSLLALGRAEAALRAAERAVALDPSLAEAHLMRGRALLALGEAERAEPAFTAALERAPESAEAWKLIAAARRARGDAAGAEAATKEVVRLRVAAPTRAPSAATQHQALNAWRPTNQAAAFGLAVEYLSLKPAFAALPFGEWSQALFRQVARGDYLFIVDREQRIGGFLGWAFADQAFAEAWIEGGAGFVNEQGVGGDCVIITAWAADLTLANRLLARAAAKLFAGRRALYFKRRYADGRERPLRWIAPAQGKPPQTTQ